MLKTEMYSFLRSLMWCAFITNWYYVKSIICKNKFRGTTWPSRSSEIYSKYLGIHHEIMTFQFLKNWSKQKSKCWNLLIAVQGSRLWYFYLWPFDIFANIFDFKYFTSQRRAQYSIFAPGQNTSMSIAGALRYFLTTGWRIWAHWT